MGHGMVGSGGVGGGGGGGGGVGLITFLGTCIRWVTEYAATLADVVNVREHKFHGRFIFLFAKLAHALGATLASGFCCVQKICCYACRC